MFSTAVYAYRRLKPLMSFKVPPSHYAANRGFTCICIHMNRLSTINELFFLKISNPAFYVTKMEAFV